MSNNIVLITVDSLRADHCGWLNQTDSTPHLDSMAADSLTFTSAISPGPRTFSSVPATHTGTPLAYTQDSIDSDDDRINRIRTHLDTFETISEELQNRGYTTVAFTANPWISDTTGFDAGFDTFVEVGKNGGNIHALFSGTPLARAAWLFDHWVYKDSFFCQWRTFYDDLIATVDELEGPVFTWIFLIDTHNPYLVPRTDRHQSSTYGMYSGLL